MTNKKLMLIPGPVSVPDEIIRAIEKPVIPHRHLLFETFFSSFLQKLKYLFQTEGRCLAASGTGTFGMEMAIYSFFKKGDTVIFPEFGKFSRKWLEYGNQLELNCIPVKTEWGKTITPEELLKVCSNQADVKGIVLTHCETSTGVLLDLEEIVSALRQKYPDIVVIVDAISSIGITPFYMDKWDVDVTLTCSQKGLMNPAGTIYYGLSDRATSHLGAEPNISSMHLSVYLSAYFENTYPYTPPVQLFFGMEKAVDNIHEKTLPVVWNQTHQLSAFFKSELKKIGGEIFCETPSDALTSFYFEGISSDKIQKDLEEKHNIWVAGGQEELKGKIIRVSHMGSVTMDDMKKCISALQEIVSTK